MVNRTPVVAEEDFTVVDLLKLIKQKSFPISYLPVINDKREVTGTITFFNLIKGEL